MNVAVQRHEAVATLRALNSGLRRPVWLFGGLAVDLLVGRWTRAHHDIDVNAFEDDRDVLSEDLRKLGFDSSDVGWLTHWALPGNPWRLEVVFLERTEPNTGTLVIAESDPIGKPGRYALPPHHLDPDRYGSLDGVRFRVSSPEGEWLARGGPQSIPRQTSDLKVKHDLDLLEEFLGAERVNALKRRVATDATSRPSL